MLLLRYSEEPPILNNGDYAPISGDSQGRLYVRLADRLDASLDSVGAARAYKSDAITFSKDTDISAPFDGRFYRNLTLYMPPAFDGASVYFETAREPGAPYFILCDSTGTPFTMNVTVNRAIAVPETIIGFGMVRIRSGTPGSPVMQTAERLVYIAGKG